MALLPRIAASAICESGGAAAERIKPNPTTAVTFQSRETPIVSLRYPQEVQLANSVRVLQYYHQNSAYHHVPPHALP